MKTVSNMFEKDLQRYEYHIDDDGQIYLGDSLEVMKVMPTESIDLIVTDPPYGIDFMGKDWDKAVPSIDVWKQCLRLLKPGAFMFVMSIPRTDCWWRMAKNIEEAGFQVSFTPIFWAYASGFPKAMNVGKMVDKRLGVERKVIGKKKGTYADIKRDEKTGQDGLHGGIAKERDRIVVNITAPATIQAKALDGSYGGFQPKPAVEIILVVMKPLSEKTYVDQALNNQKGVTWLDDCRMPYESDEDKYKEGTRKAGSELGQSAGWNDHENKDTLRQAHAQGRFPANLLVSDDILNDGKSTESPSGDRTKNTPTDFGLFKDDSWRPKGCVIQGYGDSGSFSRYFNFDGWFLNKMKDLPEGVQQTFPFILVPKASKSEKDKGLDDSFEKDIGHNRFDKCKNCGGYILQNPDRPSACKCENPARQDNRVRGNYHPTVKPLQLMSYLITLGSREDDLVLDPFMGSGSTCISAKMGGRKYIGIELQKEYCDISKGRLSVVKKAFKQATLF